MRRSSVAAAADAAACGLAPLGRRSPFESSLAVGARWAAPRLCGLDAVCRALEGDVVAQREKYLGLEPQLHTARFHVTLPRSPQNSKLSWRSCGAGAPRGAHRVAPSPASDGSTATPDSAASLSSRRSAAASAGALLKAARAGQHAAAPARTSKLTLLQMFRDIDYTGCGVVTQRQLVVALQKRPEYAGAFAQRPGGASQLEGAHRIREILDQVDTGTDGSGDRGLNWDAFVDFFRRAGLFLQYHQDDVAAVRGSELGAELEERSRASRPLPHAPACERIAAEIRTGLGAPFEIRYRSRRRATSVSECWSPEDLGSP